MPAAFPDWTPAALSSNTTQVSGGDIEFCGGFEVDFRIGFGAGDVAARKNSLENVVERAGIDVGQDAVL